MINFIFLRLPYGDTAGEYIIATHGNEIYTYNICVQHIWTSVKMNKKKEKNYKTKRSDRKKGQSSFRMHRHLSCTSIIILVAFLLTCDFAMFISFFCSSFLLCACSSLVVIVLVFFCYYCIFKASMGEMWGCLSLLSCFHFYT